MTQKNDRAESERRYRAIFENPFDLIAILDAVRDTEGSIVDWRYRARPRFVTVAERSSARCRSCAI